MINRKKLAFRPTGSATFRWTMMAFLRVFPVLLWFPGTMTAQVVLKYEQNQTVTWQGAIEMYGWLDRQFEEARLIEAGETDAGRPLHLFIISAGRLFDPDSIRAAGKTIMFINNGIHPGEPCGVDASLKLADELLSGKDPFSRFLEHTVVAIVPVLNVGGMLNRGSHFRANQDGPVEHGFRGSARNLDLNREMLHFCSTHKNRIKEVKQQAMKEKISRNEFTLRWEQDTSRYEWLTFKGYTARIKSSAVTGHPRLWYDRSDPWQREIPYYKYFEPAVTVKVPNYYILPGAWHEVTERLRLNGVEMREFTEDTVMEVEVYYIEDYHTRREPYNGHYWHSGTRVRREKQPIRFLAGDHLIPVRQKAIEYLVQTLEPGGYDSFFSWNFFDAILSRKEYFSPYVFEVTAYELLEDNPGLKSEFESLRSRDSLFRANPYLQLRYLYEHSPWSEVTYRRYPVCRWSPRGS